MPSRNNYHVTAQTDGHWNVKEESASSTSSSQDTKAEGIARAEELAKKQMSVSMGTSYSNSITPGGQLQR